MNYYDYNKNIVLTCKHCGWIGEAKDGSIEYYDQLFTVDCPQCLEPPSLLVIEYPTIVETKEAASKCNQEAISNMPVALLIEKAQKLNKLAETLVKERIQGMRKGTTDVPSWTHSLHVRDILKEGDYSHEVMLAGLLHDIVEDGNTSIDELHSLGFPERVIHLVNLCSHDLTVVGSEARWIKMMARLSDARDCDAWTIKIADLIDNLRSCHSMPEEKQHFMRHVKGELVLRLSQSLLGHDPLWKELRELVNQ